MSKTVSFPHARSPRRVAVVGMGYTGLPLAVGFADAGLNVDCLDLDDNRIRAIETGRSYLPDVDDADLTAVADRLLPTTDPDVLCSADAVVICVPTPTTPSGSPDLTAVHAVADTLGPRLQPGCLIVSQSTVPPGATKELGARLSAASGLVPGEDFGLAHAPERIDPANTAGWDLSNTPKLVGGLTSDCTRSAAELFGLVTEQVVPVSSIEVAETSKVFENTFRMVNIALTYELADLCGMMQIPVNEVIAAASSKPYGFMAHWPGPGVGGECIAVDPMFLSSVAGGLGVGLPVIDTAFERIRGRPLTVTDRLGALLRSRGTDLNGSQVLVVGVSYKPGVADLRNAPSIDLIRSLRAKHAKVSYTDPMVPELAVDDETVPHVEWSREFVSAFDCLVLTTPHEQIMKRPLWYASPMLLDCWHAVQAGDGVFHL